MEARQTTFYPNPVQKSFIESRAKADLYSSRMGEGKSTALVWSTLYHTRHNPGAAWFLIRDTWENLQATTMKSFFEWFPQGVYGTYHAGKKEWTWAEGVAKGTVGFLGMDAPEDASKLQSRPMSGFGMDEPAPAVGSAGIDEYIFDIAMSRLRHNPEGTQWYAAKLAINNPDETHWTYRRFVGHPNEDFLAWQPRAAENEANLPPGYYAELRKLWSHRPDLIRRFVEGEYGFQQIGKSVTPQWSDKIHLARGLVPVKGSELILLWDFGLNPTCIITQKTPLGHWLILDALVGDGIGVMELIQDGVKPILSAKYRPWLGMQGMSLRHIGDPAGEAREQSSSQFSAVRVIKKELGGQFRRGPIKPQDRYPDLQAVLSRTLGGTGLVQVDKDNAPAVWQALRGGWYYHVSRTGITSTVAVKNVHSHPGDAMSYGAAILFPMGKLVRTPGGMLVPETTSYFGRRPVAVRPPPPPHGSKLIL